jgi:hypothetical protein
MNGTSGFQQDAEKVRQLRSRFAQKLNVLKRTPRLLARCGLAGRAFLSILLEVLSSTSRSPSSCFLHEQRPQFGTGSWPLFRTHDLIALSTGISTKRETVPDTVSITGSNLANIPWDTRRWRPPISSGCLSLQRGGTGGVGRWL